MRDLSEIGFPGYYLNQLGENDWEIIGKRGKPMKLELNGDYLGVFVYVNKKTRWLALHRAIALVYHPDTWFEGAEVDHFPDRNTLNNRISNLRWATESEQNFNRDMSSYRTPEYREFRRQLMSAVSKRNWANAEYREVMTGWKHTDDARAKISAGHLGRKASDATRAKISAAMRGHSRKHSAETRAKIAATQKKRLAQKKAAGYY
jgi:hypothetical protein